MYPNDDTWSVPFRPLSDQDKEDDSLVWRPIPSGTSSRPTPCLVFQGSPKTDYLSGPSFRTNSPTLLRRSDSEFQSPRPRFGGYLPPRRPGGGSPPSAVLDVSPVQISDHPTPVPTPVVPRYPSSGRETDPTDHVRPIVNLSPPSDRGDLSPITVGILKTETWK